MRNFYAKLAGLCGDLAGWLERRAIGTTVIRAYQKALDNPSERNIDRASQLLDQCLDRLTTFSSARQTAIKCRNQIAAMRPESNATKNG